jgi:hypothetical protein
MQEGGGVGGGVSPSWRLRLQGGEYSKIGQGIEQESGILSCPGQAQPCRTSRE